MRIRSQRGIKRKHLKSLFKKWNLLSKYDKKINFTHTRKYVLNFYKLSNTEIKQIAKLISADEEHSKENFLFILLMREELKMMHKDGFFSKETAHLIAECVILLNFDNFEVQIEEIIKLIPFATNFPLNLENIV